MSDSTQSERPGPTFGLVLLGGFGLGLGASLLAAFALYSKVPFLGRAPDAALATLGGMIGLGMAAFVWRTRLTLIDIARFALAPLAVGVGTWFVWDDWHFTVWTDNGTTSAISIRFAGRDLTIVPPGEQRKHVLPQIDGALEAFSQDGKLVQRVQRPQLSWLELRRSEYPPKMEGAVHIFNVAERHCYELHEGEYDERPHVG